MGWHNLAKPDGRDVDQFDNKHAVHMLYIEHREVLGYQRLLPSTRPHLLSGALRGRAASWRRDLGDFAPLRRAGPSIRRTLRESDWQRPWVGLARMGP
jgi:hypothetical protein